MEKEQAKWRVTSTVKVYFDPTGEVDRQIRRGEQVNVKPIKIMRDEGNSLTNVGIDLFMQKLIGGAGQVFDNSHARVGVGTGTTEAAAEDTDLESSGVWVAMVTGFPQQANQTLLFRGSFGPTVANQNWTEWAVDNGSVAHVLLNRKCPVAFGVKLAGETRVLDVIARLI